VNVDWWIILSHVATGLTWYLAGVISGQRSERLKSLQRENARLSGTTVRATKDDVR